MPSRFATMKRNAPTNFEESQRPVKMMRTDYIPSPVHYFAMMPAPATAPYPSKGAVKRKFGVLDASLNFATSATKRSRTGCRGGKKRARGPRRPQRPRRAIVDVKSEDALGGSTDAPSGKDTAGVSASTEGDATVSTSEDAIKAEDDNSQDNDEVATVEISPPSVGEDTAKVPVTAEGAAAVTASEDAVKTDDDSGEANETIPSSPSAAEGTAEVPAAMKEDVMATASELAEALFSAMVGEDTAESPTSVEGEAAAAATECDVKAEDDTDAPADQDTVEVSTSTKENAVKSTSECAAEAQNDSNNSSEPVSSSRKSVSGSIESADSSSSSESASSSPKSANTSSETLDTIVSEPEVAPKKPISMAGKQERYVTGLYNHGNQCFANATLQMFDAALDGHDLDLVMGKEESNENFEIRDKEILGLYGKIKAGVQGRIRRFRSEGRLKDINPRKHLRALLSRMRGRKDTPQPETVAPLVFQQVLALGGEDTMFEHLDGTTQEDCYEYFCALMNRATSTTIEESDPAPEDDIGSATRLKSLFGIKSETIKECESGCGWKGPVQYESNDSVSTSVWKSAKSLDIHDMLKKSRKSTCEDQKCPKCGKETLASVTELKEVSDNFVVHINRVEGYEPRKIQTAVELPLKEIPICGKKFMLNAVVRHKGATVDGGHYTAFRRRASEWLTDEKSLWYLINDEDVQAIDKSDVKDNWRGQSAMLLFKAV
jgi:ubiquitin C-terminal hydrolase